MESEEKLQQEVKEGNRQAMHQLYERYAGYAASVVRRYVSDSDAAHDLLQDSFVKVFTRIDSFDYRPTHPMKTPTWSRCRPRC